MLNNFFLEHPVFTVEEFRNYHLKENDNIRKAEAALAYYCKRGRIKRLKRGIYVSAGSDNKFHPDPFLIASRLSDDAVLIHHTALEFHGYAYSVFNHFTYQTERAVRDFRYANWLFQSVSIPQALRRAGKGDFGINNVDYSGMNVKVASPERTLVDVLNCHKYSGGWEEIWRSIESIEFFDLDVVAEYIKLLNNSTTAAAVGFFLEQHKDRLMVPDQYLDNLRRQRPKAVHYLDRARRDGKLVKEWNLIVPEELLTLSWDELT